METRREFLRRAAKGTARMGTATLWAAPFAGCAGLPERTVSEEAPERVVVGSARSRTEREASRVVGEALDVVGTEWLRPGDSVFVKLASNAAQPHPATTSPASVRAIVQQLFDRGAGRVIVGDQAGVESVRATADGARYSSTRRVVERNGLLAAIEDSGAEPHFFEERDFDEGYVAVEFDFADGHESSWERPPYIARIAEEVDHIVYAPRLSSHALTGYTHGHKLAVGWLRDDSRHLMHHAAGTIYEKYTELSYAAPIVDRLRATVTLVESVLVSNGPDFGAIATLDTPLVLASAHLANHDALSVRALLWAMRNRAAAPANGGIGYGPWASVTNGVFVNSYVEQVTGIPWTSEDPPPGSGYGAHDYAAGIAADRQLSRAYALLGGVGSHIPLERVGAPLPDGLLDAIRGLARVTG